MQPDEYPTYWRIALKPVQPKKLGLLKWNKNSGFASLFLYKEYHEMDPYDKCCALEAWIVKLTQLRSIENEKSKAMFEDIRNRLHI